MTSQFTLEVRVREEVGAWEECLCDGGRIIRRVPVYEGNEFSHFRPDDLGECKPCHGSGGKWNEAVREIWVIEGTVTKSTTLYRFHDACKLCGGSGHCSRCNGTGCEPGTATRWEVSDE